MPPPDTNRIKVLVVDDDDSWGEGLDLQSRRLSTSQLDLEYKSRFADGLKRVEEEPNIDVIVVDLFLDDKLAFDFIFEARKLGVVAPFIIVSQASKQDIINYDGKDLLSEMIQSSAADFLEKSSIRPFKIFQQKVQEALVSFRYQTELTMNSIEKRQREYLIEAFYVISELRLLRDIIYSYAEKVKICSFENICSAIDDRLNKIEYFLSNAYFDLDPEQHGKGRVLALPLPKENLPERSPGELAVIDMIPYCPGQTRIKKRVAASVKKLRKRIQEKGDISDVCKTIYGELTSVANDSLVENAFFQIAENSKSLSINQSIEILYQLSLIYEKMGKNNRIPVLDAAAAIMLIDEGKMTEAATYLKSARRRAAVSGNDSLVATIDAIAPDHTAFEVAHGGRA